MTYSNRMSIPKTYNLERQMFCTRLIKYKSPLSIILNLWELLPVTHVKKEWKEIYNNNKKKPLIVGEPKWLSHVSAQQIWRPKMIASNGFFCYHLNDI